MQNGCIEAWRALDAVDAGRIDLKAHRNGRICFIEANPLAGLKSGPLRPSNISKNVWY